MPARPVYEVTIGSYTNGWSFTFTQGEVPDLLDGAWLRDDLRLVWGWPAGAYPGQLVPTTCSFSIYCETAADVPAVNQGEHVYIHIDRPTAGTPIPWAHVDAVLDDPVLVVEGNGLRLDLIAVDMVAPVGELLVDNNPPREILLPNGIAQSDGAGGYTFTSGGTTGAGNVFANGDELMTRLLTICLSAPFNFVQPVPYGIGAALSQGPAVVDNANALQLLNDVLGSLYTTPNPDRQLVLRAVRKLYSDSFFADDLAAGDNIWLSAGIGVPVIYFLMELGRLWLLDTPFVLADVNHVGTMQARAGRPSALDGGVVIDADNVPTAPTSWRKSRAAAVNQIKLVGLTSLGDEYSITASYPDLVAEFGANTRVIQTQAWLNNPAIDQLAAATSYLPDRSAAEPAWVAEKFQFVTKQLDDTDLDNYADSFYPHPSVVAGTDLVKPIVIRNVDATQSVTGDYIAGQLIAGELVISGGELVINGTIRPETLPLGAGTDAITSAQLAASPLAAMRSTGAGVQLRIDPTLTALDFRLIGI